MKKFTWLAIAVAILYVAVVILTIRAFGVADNEPRKLTSRHDAIAVDVVPWSEPTPLPGNEGR